MHYLIDGYNLIFALFDVGKNLQSLRDTLITALQERFAERNLSGSIVFDGKETGYAYPSPLTIIYAPSSADEYIVEKVRLSKSPTQITVITNDRGLTRHVRSYGAHVQSNEDFLHFLQKKRQKSHKDPVESKANFDRLLKIFEDRLSDEI